MIATRKHTCDRRHLDGCRYTVQAPTPWRVNFRHTILALCLWVLAFAAGIVIAAALAGCRSIPTPTPTTATGNAIVKAEVRGQSAQSHVEQIKPADQPSEVHQQTAIAELTAQKYDLKVANDDLEKVQSGITALYNHDQKVTNSWGYRLQVLVTRLFWWIAGLGVLACVLTGLFPFLGPTLQWFLSLAGHGLMTIITAGLWWVPELQAWAKRKLQGVESATTEKAGQ